MKARRREGEEARAVLAAMATDRTVLSRVAGQWTMEGLFDAPWANLVGGWMVDYLRKYGDVPNGQLRDIYTDWSRTTKMPEETVRGVERFLLAAAREQENDGQKNSDWQLDRAAKYFAAVKVRRAIQRAEELEELGKPAEAFEELANLKRIEMGEDSVCRVVSDYDAWRQAYDQERQDSLIYYPGKLQGFLGKWLNRDSLYAFMAPDKTGKSVFLLDLAYRAVRNRCRVAYFDVGDNSQDQVLRRLGARALRVPSVENFKSKLRIPVSVDRDGEISTETREFDGPPTQRAAYNAVKKTCRGIDRLWICCRPNTSTSVDDISAKLSSWERELRWVPDVLVIDYADILAPPYGVRDTLDQIDETWKALRRMSQEKHCLVVTATQSSAAAYGDKAKVLRKQHFSGRKTKLAHVNGMIGVNVSENDRKNGVARLNWIVRREGRFRESYQAVVAGCWEWYEPVRRVAE